MQIITAYSPRGGSGRSTVVMALASGFLALGKRVLVMDATEYAGGVWAQLRGWVGVMEDHGFGAAHLGYVECAEASDLRDAVETARAQGVEIILIDTGRDYGPRRAALDSADLVLMPATTPLLAQAVGRSFVEEALLDRAVGVITGDQSGTDFPEGLRSHFGSCPVLRSELPFSDVINLQCWQGDLETMVLGLACKPGAQGYAAYREAQRAWASVQLLTAEVCWALEGQFLRPAQAANTSHLEREIA